MLLLDGLLNWSLNELLLLVDRLDRCDWLLLLLDSGWSLNGLDSWNHGVDSLAHHLLVLLSANNWNSRKHGSRRAHHWLVD